MTPAEAARALGGEVVRGGVLCPGPGHSRADRSLSVRFSHQAPDGFVTYSHAGDDFVACRNHVASRLAIMRGGRAGLVTALQRPAARADPAVPTDAERIARAVAIWAEGRDPRGTVVETYLRSRGLELDDVVAGAALRFHSACPWREGDRTVRVPAMVAALRSVLTNEITGVHRTRLTDDGRKVDRRMLGLAAGSAVRLDPDQDVTMGLVIGEGIETCMAGRSIDLRPAWAMGSAGGIAKLPVLGGVEALTILAEHDETGVNARAVEECGGRWHAAEREVVVITPAFGSDMNDAVRGAA